MRFGDSDMLIYIPFVISVIILFYLWAGSQYKRAAIRFAKKAALDKISPKNNRTLRRKKMFLNILAVLFIGLALSRPQWGVYWKEKREKGLDILIALDTSKSMLAQDMKPDRLSFAKAEIKDFVKGLEGDRVGLMAFAGDAFLYCPLTMDYDGFFLVLNNIKVGSVRRGGTDIPESIKEAIRSFKWSQTEKKVLVLITDGENTEGDVKKAVDDAGREGVQIFCVGVGTTEGNAIQYVDDKGKPEVLKDEEGRPVKSRLDEKTLQEISQETGGLYVRATNARFGLDYIYDKALSKLKKLDREETLAKSYRERFQIPLVIAFLALSAEMVLTLVNRDAKN